MIQHLVGLSEDQEKLAIFGPGLWSRHRDGFIKRIIVINRKRNLTNMGVFIVKWLKMLNSLKTSILKVPNLSHRRKFCCWLRITAAVARSHSFQLWEEQRQCEDSEDSCPFFSFLVNNLQGFSFLPYRVIRCYMIIVWLRKHPSKYLPIGHRI